MKEKIRLLPKESSAEYQRMCFGSFSFPILPSLTYQADGPDKENPDRLFIVDKEERFMLYSEARDDSTEDKLPSPPDCDTIEIVHHSKQLTLCYPLQQERPNISVGYFKIEFLSRENIPSCYGDLSITLPEPYFDGIRKFTDLYILFVGLAVCERK